jgi:hypothetical protein
MKGLLHSLAVLSLIAERGVDLEELIQLMQDCPTGQMVRCSKARAMFAMRACRKSIMVGMPLTRRQMKSVGVSQSGSVLIIDFTLDRSFNIWARWINRGIVLTVDQRCAIYRTWQT